MKTIPAEVITAINALFVATHRLEVFIKKTSMIDTTDPSDLEFIEMIRPSANEAIHVAFNALDTIANCKIGYSPGDHGAFEQLKGGAL